MQKIIATTSILFLSSFSTLQANTNFQSGFTAGAAFGYSQMNSRTQEKVNVLGFPVNPNQGDSRRNVDSGVVGDIAAGYRLAFNNGFVVGADVTFSLDSNKAETKQNFFGVDSITKTSRDFQIVPSLLLGKVIAPQWMLFAKLGLSISRFKVDSTYQTAPVNKVTSRKTRLGFMPTLGAEYALNKNISVLTTLAYEYVSEMKVKQKDPSLGAFIGSTHDVKVRPHYFTAKLGVLYKF